MSSIYFNPQGPRGPRLRAGGDRNVHIKISIHKALAGLDRVTKSNSRAVTYFNPQGPRGPRRWTYTPNELIQGISIHKALAGLDCSFNSSRCSIDDFNPQGPRGPRPCTVSRIPVTISISIHKALAGLDLQRGGWASDNIIFQSTRPSRASTIWKIDILSIQQNFNPQGPRGPRPSGRRSYRQCSKFQSTRPSRASTCAGCKHWHSI